MACGLGGGEPGRCERWLGHARPMVNESSVPGEGGGGLLKGVPPKLDPGPWTSLPPPKLRTVNSTH